MEKAIIEIIKKSIPYFSKTDLWLCEEEIKELIESKTTPPEKLMEEAREEAQKRFKYDYNINSFSPENSETRGNIEGFEQGAQFIINRLNGLEK